MLQVPVDHGAMNSIEDRLQFPCMEVPLLLLLADRSFIVGIFRGHLHGELQMMIILVNSARKSEVQFQSLLTENSI